jgi:hypothetical protein
LDSGAESAILAALGSGQITAAELKRRVKAKVRLDNEQYTAQLNALLAQRKIHQRRNLGRDGRPTRTLGSYAVGAPPPPPPPPREAAPQMILKILEAGPVAVVELRRNVKKALPELKAGDFSVVLAELAASGQVYGRRKRGKGGKLGAIDSYVLGGRPAAEFIAPVMRVWTDVQAEARTAGVTREALVAALFQTLAAEGFSVPNASVAASPSDDRADVMRSVRILEAREGRGALIPIRKLRAALPLGKERLDAALLGLYAEDAVILHHHDYVGNLSDVEREELVLDRHGNYYVGVALRGDS